MTTIVKERDPLVVPLTIRRRAGIKPGDRLEFKAARGVITIVSGHGLTPMRRLNSAVSSTLNWRKV